MRRVSGSPHPLYINSKDAGHAFQDGDLDVPGLEGANHRVRIDLHLDGQGVDGYVAHPGAFDHAGQFPRIGVVHGCHPVLHN